MEEPTVKGKVKRPRMKTSSAKAKGRRLQQFVRDAIRVKYQLPESDVVSTPMSVPGLDIQLSAHARTVFNYGCECKNCESLSIYKVMEQCEMNAKKHHLKPLAVFSRNNTPKYAVIRFEEFMRLLPSGPAATTDVAGLADVESEDVPQEESDEDIIDYTH